MIIRWCMGVQRNGSWFKGDRTRAQDQESEVVVGRGKESEEIGERMLREAGGRAAWFASLLARLEGAADQPSSVGASRLGDVHRERMQRAREARVAAARAQTELERREELYVSARRSF